MNYQSTDGFGNQYNQNYSGNTTGEVFNQQMKVYLQQAALQQMCQEKRKMYSGTKPLIVVGGVVVAEAKDMDEAQRLAEEHAHKSSANAYILKPVKMVAPKRDVVTTDL